MNRISEKIYLTLTPPAEEENSSIQQKLLSELSDRGYTNIHLSLPALRQLYSTCLTGDYHITVTIVWQEEQLIIVSVEAGDTRAAHYGLAVDYGSTTIIMQLVNLHTGEILAQVSEKNGQITYGTDILTRITYTMENAPDPAHLNQEHVDNIHLATIKTFHLLLDRLTQETAIPVRKCQVMILSGNTTMIHFLLKLDARTVFFAPYVPVTMNPGWFSGQELGFDFSGMVYIIPAVSNYVGGDIVSGLLTMDFYKKEEVSVFFDIGTNGELVIGNKDWLLAGAGAAGPALEGYISKFGMRAQPGAVDTVAIQNGHLSVTTIDHQKPIGICGSGIIDLLAQMRLNNWINIAGHLNPQISDQIAYIPDEEQYAVIYASAEESGIGQPLYFSQTDIDQYLDTKAAAFTMIDSLLSTAGCVESDIAHCYLSGAFTAHSDLESAITIGIFPDLPREKFTVIKNSSLDGARLLLLDRSRFNDIQHLTDTIYCVQFASDPEFLIRMQAAKFIPHTDMKRFPSIKQRT